MTVEFRVATPDDAQAVLAIYAPYCSSTHVSFETAPPSEAQMRERIERVTSHYPWLIGEIDGQVGGYVYATQHRERAAYRWSVDVAVYIAESHHRRSLGRALYTSLFALLREQGLFQAYAGITLPNAASVGLHESVGFQPVAVFPKVGYKLDRWLDVGWWRLQLTPEIENPRDPRIFSTIRNSPTLAAALAEGARVVRPGN
jgi:L-amino acid N-acyltransferase YncA